jgi:glycogen debranching enzyme
MLKTGRTVAALNNGWVMGADTNENLVTTKNFYYLRRRVSVWGDLIRIRYGSNLDDSPAVAHMKKYVQTMAKYFDGFRLDNLHGTQLNVAQVMIKEARKIRPEIIVFAELFTNTEK